MPAAPKLSNTVRNKKGPNLEPFLSASLPDSALFSRKTDFAEARSFEGESSENA
jgi:hypothetical protein